MSRNIQQHGWTILLFLLTFPFSISSSATAESDSNFIHVRLPRGIELQIPKDWQLQGADYKKEVLTTAKSAIEQTGIEKSDGQLTNFVLANPDSKSTYAEIRVDSIIPPSIAPSMFSSITAADLRELQTAMRQTLTKLLTHMGSQMIDYHGVRLEKTSGYHTLVTEYRRAGPQGPVVVQVNQIFTPAQCVIITLSYRESEKALWKTVIEKVRQSVVMSHWP